VSLDKWHTLLGKLQSICGLFSLLQEAFRHPDNSTTCLWLSQAVHCTLQDFRALHGDLANCPTRYREVIPQGPSLIGSHDASGHGPGGIWLWCHARPRRWAPLPQVLPNPHAMTHYLPQLHHQTTCEHSQPHGSLTSSDLELAGRASSIWTPLPKTSTSAIKPCCPKQTTWQPFIGKAKELER